MLLSLRPSITIILAFALWLSIWQCKPRTNEFSFCKDNEKINVDLRYPLLRLVCLTDDDKVPDSILNKPYKILYIESPSLTNYAEILSRVNPSEIEMITIGTYYKNVSFSEDLRRFKKLKDLTISGGENLETVNLKGKLDSNLEKLTIESSRVKFPEFDSSFLSLRDLVYSGIENEVPKWVENLDSVRSLVFSSNHIESIEADLCLMHALNVFDISTSDYYHHEQLFFEQNKKYDKLSRFSECNPGLKFKTEPLHYY